MQSLAITDTWLSTAPNPPISTSSIESAGNATRGGRIGHGSRTNPADPSAFVVPGLNPDSISTRRTCQASFRVAETPAVAHREGGGSALPETHTPADYPDFGLGAARDTHPDPPPIDFCNQTLVGKEQGRTGRAGMNFEFWLGFTKEARKSSNV